MTDVNMWSAHVRLALIAGVIAVIVGASAAAAASQTPSTPAPAKGSFVDVSGVRLWVVDTGGSGVPIVLLHPYTGNTEIWEPQIAAFAKAGYRVIAYDRRRWGRSTADAPPAGTRIYPIDDLEALVARLALPRFHLVGVAGGGFVALDYAAAYPNRLRSLVVGASNGGGVQDAAFTEVARRVATPGINDMTEIEREISKTYRAANPTGVTRWQEIEHNSRPAQQTGRAREDMKTPQTLAKFATIKTQTLVIAGDEDLLAPPDLMRAWAAPLPNHQFTVLPKAGHAMTWEQPQNFSRLVLEFLAKH